MNELEGIFGSEEKAQEECKFLIVAALRAAREQDVEVLGIAITALCADHKDMAAPVMVMALSMMAMGARILQLQETLKDVDERRWDE